MSTEFKTVNSGTVTSPQGFLAGAVKAGIKSPDKLDIGILYSEAPCVAAGVFTTNVIKAAPIILSRKNLRNKKAQALVVNSGCANACTGDAGLADAAEMASLTARKLSLKPEDVLVASTGVIGVPLPMERIREGIDKISISGHGGADLAGAMMTTDTFTKEIALFVELESGGFTIGGVAKGAGMIHPNMATMLCFIMTDIAVNQRTLDKILKESVEKSFNRITIDGDRSTNDTVLIMANGMIGNALITEKSESYIAFKKALHKVTLDLSKLIVKDGEGATKFIEIELKGARSKTDAEKAAFAVANSNLVKTAIYGSDANWGRIVTALGYSGIAIKEEKIDIYFGKIKVAGKGLTTGKDKEAIEVLKEEDVKIVIDLHLGRSSAKVLTCDLTEEYIRVNAAYRT